MRQSIAQVPGMTAPKLTVPSVQKLNGFMPFAAQGLSPSQLNGTQLGGVQQQELRKGCVVEQMGNILEATVKVWNENDTRTIPQVEK